MRSTRGLITLGFCVLCLILISSANSQKSDDEDLKDDTQPCGATSSQVVSKRTGAIKNAKNQKLAVQTLSKSNQKSTKPYANKAKPRFIDGIGDIIETIVQGIGNLIGSIINTVANLIGIDLHWDDLINAIVNFDPNEQKDAAAIVQYLLQLVGVYKGNVENAEIAVILEKLKGLLHITTWPEKWPDKKVTVNNNGNDALMKLLIKILKNNSDIDADAILKLIYEAQSINQITIVVNIAQENEMISDLINQMIISSSPSHSEAILANILLYLIESLQNSTANQAQIKLDPALLMVIMKILGQDKNSQYNEKIVKLLVDVIKQMEKQKPADANTVTDLLRILLDIIKNRGSTSEPIDISVLNRLVAIIKIVKPEWSVSIVIPQQPTTQLPALPETHLPTLPPTLPPTIPTTTFKPPSFPLPTTPRNVIDIVVNEMKEQHQVDNVKLAAVVQYILQLMGINKSNALVPQNAAILQQILSLLKLNRWPYDWLPTSVNSNGINKSYMTELFLQFVSNIGGSSIDFDLLENLIIKIGQMNSAPNIEVSDSSNAHIINLVIEIINVMQNSNDDIIEHTTSSTILRLLLEFIDERHHLNPHSGIDVTILEVLYKYFTTFYPDKYPAVIGMLSQMITAMQNADPTVNRERLMLRIMLEIINNYGSNAAAQIDRSLLRQIFTTLSSISKRGLGIIFDEFNFKVFAEIIDRMPNGIITHTLVRSLKRTIATLRGLLPSVHIEFNPGGILQGLWDIITSPLDVIGGFIGRRRKRSVEDTKISEAIKMEVLKRILKQIMMDNTSTQTGTRSRPTTLKNNKQTEPKLVKVFHSMKDPRKIEFPLVVSVELLLEALREKNLSKLSAKKLKTMIELIGNSLIQRANTIESKGSEGITALIKFAFEDIANNYTAIKFDPLHRRFRHPEIKRIEDIVKRMNLLSRFAHLPTASYTFHRLNLLLEMIREYSGNKEVKKTDSEIIPLLSKIHDILKDNEHVHKDNFAMSSTKTLEIVLRGMKTPKLNPKFKVKAATELAIRILQLYAKLLEKNDPKVLDWSIPTLTLLFGLFETDKSGHLADSSRSIIEPFQIVIETIKKSGEVKKLQPKLAMFLRFLQRMLPIMPVDGAIKDIFDLEYVERGAKGGDFARLGFLLEVAMKYQPNWDDPKSSAKELHDNLLHINKVRADEEEREAKPDRYLLRILKDILHFKTPTFEELVERLSNIEKLTEPPHINTEEIRYILPRVLHILDLAPPPLDFFNIENVKWILLKVSNISRNLDKYAEHSDEIIIRDAFINLLFPNVKDSNNTSLIITQKDSTLALLRKFHALSQANKTQSIVKAIKVPINITKPQVVVETVKFNRVALKEVVEKLWVVLHDNTSSKTLNKTLDISDPLQNQTINIKHVLEKLWIILNIKEPNPGIDQVVLERLIQKLEMLLQQNPNWIIHQHNIVIQLIQQLMIMMNHRPINVLPSPIVTEPNSIKHIVQQLVIILGQNQTNQTEIQDLNIKKLLHHLVAILHKNPVKPSNPTLNYVLEVLVQFIESKFEIGHPEAVQKEKLRNMFTILLNVLESRPSYDKVSIIRSLLEVNEKIRRILVIMMQLTSDESVVVENPIERIQIMLQILHNLISKFPERTKCVRTGKVTIGLGVTVEFDVTSRGRNATTKHKIKTRSTYRRLIKKKRPSKELVISLLRKEEKIN